MIIQSQIDQLISEHLAEQQAKEITACNANGQKTVDDFIQQIQSESNLSMNSHYMTTMEYQCLLYYTSQLPYCIQHAMQYGIFSFVGIGKPDEELLIEIQNQCQMYLDNYYSEAGKMKAVIVSPQYTEMGNIYKPITTEYSLIIQKLEKIK